MDRMPQGDKKVAEKRRAAEPDSHSIHESFNVFQQPTATIRNDDERLLARIGYRQELHREFTKW